jgi:hypothetical protein
MTGQHGAPRWQTRGRSQSVYSREVTEPSEDCLYVNVWAPLAGRRTRRSPNGPQPRRALRDHDRCRSDPNGEGLPSWPDTTPRRTACAKDRVMEFGSSIGAEAHPSTFARIRTRLGGARHLQRFGEPLGRPRVVSDGGPHDRNDRTGTKP